MLEFGFIMTTERGKAAWAQANRMIPDTQAKDIALELGAYAGIFLSPPVVILSWSSPELFPLLSDHRLLTGATGALLYMISALADNRSTIRGFRAMDKAREAGVPIP